MVLSELKTYNIKIVDKFWLKTNEIKYDLYQPVNQSIFKKVKNFYSSESCLILVKRNQETIGHVICFLNHRKKQLEFGFFGTNNHTNENIAITLLEQIEELSKKWNVERIIGPVNTPAVIYLYGFDIEKQKKYLDLFRLYDYMPRHQYNIYNIPIQNWGRLRKPHGNTHLCSGDIEQEDLKNKLRVTIEKVIGEITNDLIIPIKLMDIMFDVVNEYGHPEFIQIALNELSDIVAYGILIPDFNLPHIMNNGKSDQIRIGSGGMVKNHKKKGYGFYHMHYFFDACKRYNIKRFLLGQSDINNTGITKLVNKLDGGIEISHIILQKELKKT